MEDQGRAGNPSLHSHNTHVPSIQIDPYHCTSSSSFSSSALLPSLPSFAPVPGTIVYAQPAVPSAASAATPAVSPPSSLHRLSSSQPPFLASPSPPTLPVLSHAGPHLVYFPLVVANPSSSSSSHPLGLRSAAPPAATIPQPYTHHPSPGVPSSSSSAGSAPFAPSQHAPASFVLPLAHTHTERTAPLAHHPALSSSREENHLLSERQVSVQHRGLSPIEREREKAGEDRRLPQYAQTRRAGQLQYPNEREEGEGGRGARVEGGRYPSSHSSLSASFSAFSPSQRKGNSEVSVDPYASSSSSSSTPDPYAPHTAVTQASHQRASSSSSSLRFSSKEEGHVASATSTSSTPHYYSPLSRSSSFHGALPSQSPEGEERRRGSRGREKLTDPYSSSPPPLSLPHGGRRRGDDTLQSHRVPIDVRALYYCRDLSSSSSSSLKDPFGIATRTATGLEEKAGRSGEPSSSSLCGDRVPGSSSVAEDAQWSASSSLLSGNRTALPPLTATAPPSSGVLHLLPLSSVCQSAPVSPAISTPGDGDLPRSRLPPSRRYEETLASPSYHDDPRGKEWREEPYDGGHSTPSSLPFDSEREGEVFQQTRGARREEPKRRSPREDASASSSSSSPCVPLHDPFSTSRRESYSRTPSSRHGHSSSCSSSSSTSSDTPRAGPGHLVCHSRHHAGGKPLLRGATRGTRGGRGGGPGGGGAVVLDRRTFDRRKFEHPAAQSPAEPTSSSRYCQRQSPEKRHPTASTSNTPPPSAAPSSRRHAPSTSSLRGQLLTPPPSSSSACRRRMREEGGAEEHEKQEEDDAEGGEQASRRPPRRNRGEQQRGERREDFSPSWSSLHSLPLTRSSRGSSSPSVVSSSKAFHQRHASSPPGALLPSAAFSSSVASPSSLPPLLPSPHSGIPGQRTPSASSSSFRSPQFSALLHTSGPARGSFSPSAASVMLSEGSPSSSSTHSKSLLGPPPAGRCLFASALLRKVARWQHAQRRGGEDEKDAGGRGRGKGKSPSLEEGEELEEGEVSHSVGAIKKISNGSRQASMLHSPSSSSSSCSSSSCASSSLSPDSLERSRRSALSSSCETHQDPAALVEDSDIEKSAGSHRRRKRGCSINRSSGEDPTCRQSNEENGMLSSEPCPVSSVETSSLDGTPRPSTQAEEKGDSVLVMTTGGPRDLHASSCGRQTSFVSDSLPCHDDLRSREAQAATRPPQGNLESDESGALSVKDMKKNENSTNEESGEEMKDEGGKDPAPPPSLTNGDRSTDEAKTPDVTARTEEMSAVRGVVRDGRGDSVKGASEEKKEGLLRRKKPPGDSVLLVTSDSPAGEVKEPRQQQQEVEEERDYERLREVRVSGPGDSKKKRLRKIRNLRVAIVGAGMAGVSAGVALKEAGVRRIVIYEARNRVGGRCCSVSVEIPEEEEEEDEESDGPDEEAEEGKVEEKDEALRDRLQQDEKEEGKVKGENSGRCDADEGGRKRRGEEGRKEEEVAVAETRSPEGIRPRSSTDTEKGERKEEQEEERSSMEKEGTALDSLEAGQGQDNSKETSVTPERETSDNPVPRSVDSAGKPPFGTTLLSSSSSSSRCLPPDPTCSSSLLGTAPSSSSSPPPRTKVSPPRLRQTSSSQERNSKNRTTKKTSHSRAHTRSQIVQGVDLGASWIHGIDDNPVYAICLDRHLKPFGSASGYDEDEEGEEVGQYPSLGGFRQTFSPSLHSGDRRPTGADGEAGRTRKSPEEDDVPMTGVKGRDGSGSSSNGSQEEEPTGGRRRAGGTGEDPQNQSSRSLESVDATKSFDDGIEKKKTTSRESSRSGSLSRCEKKRRRSSSPVGDRDERGSDDHEKHAGSTRDKYLSMIPVEEALFDEATGELVDAEIDLWAYTAHQQHQREADISVGRGEEEQRRLRWGALGSHIGKEDQKRLLHLSLGEVLNKKMREAVRAANRRRKAAEHETTKTENEKKEGEEDDGDEDEMEVELKNVESEDDSVLTGSCTGTGSFSRMREDEGDSGRTCGQSENKKTSLREEDDYEEEEAGEPHDEDDDIKEGREGETLEGRLLMWHLNNLEYSAGADVEDLSMICWDQDDLTAFQGRHMLIWEGYRAAVEVQAKDLDIRLNHVLSKLRYDDEGVTLFFEDGTVSPRFDFCVLTLPLGLLKASVELYERGGDGGEDARNLEISEGLSSRVPCSASPTCATALQEPGTAEGSHARPRKESAGSPSDVKGGRSCSPDAGCSAVSAHLRRDVEERMTSTEREGGEVEKREEDQERARGGGAGAVPQLSAPFSSSPSVPDPGYQEDLGSSTTGQAVVEEKEETERRRERQGAEQEERQGAEQEEEEEEEDDDEDEEVCSRFMSLSSVSSSPDAFSPIVTSSSDSSAGPGTPAGEPADESLVQSSSSSPGCSSFPLMPSLSAGEHSKIAASSEPTSYSLSRSSASLSTSRPSCQYSACLSPSQAMPGQASLPSSSPFLVSRSSPSAFDSLSSSFSSLPPLPLSVRPSSAPATGLAPAKLHSLSSPADSATQPNDVSTCFSDLSTVPSSSQSFSSPPPRRQPSSPSDSSHSSSFSSSSLSPSSPDTSHRDNAQMEKELSSRPVCVSFQGDEDKKSRERTGGSSLPCFSTEDVPNTNTSAVDSCLEDSSQLAPSSQTRTNPSSPPHHQEEEAKSKEQHILLLHAVDKGESPLETKQGEEKEDGDEGVSMKGEGALSTEEGRQSISYHASSRMRGRRSSTTRSDPKGSCMKKGSQTKKACKRDERRQSSITPSTLKKNRRIRDFAGRDVVCKQLHAGLEFSSEEDHPLYDALHDVPVRFDRVPESLLPFLSLSSSRTSSSRRKKNKAERDDDTEGRTAVAFPKREDNEKKEKEEKKKKSAVCEGGSEERENSLEEVPQEEKKEDHPEQKSTGCESEEGELRREQNGRGVKEEIDTTPKVEGGSSGGLKTTKEENHNEDAKCVGHSEDACLASCAMTAKALPPPHQANFAEEVSDMGRLEDRGLSPSSLKSAAPLASRTRAQDPHSEVSFRSGSASSSSSCASSFSVYTPPPPGKRERSLSSPASSLSCCSPLKVEEVEEREKETGAVAAASVVSFSASLPFSASSAARETADAPSSSSSSLDPPSAPACSSTSSASSSSWTSSSRTLPFSWRERWHDLSSSRCSSKRGVVTFDPPLPEWKREAIKLVGMGNMNKVALVFRTPFWLEGMENQRAEEEEEEEDEANKRKHEEEEKENTEDRPCCCGGVPEGPLEGQRKNERGDEVVALDARGVGPSNSIEGGEDKSRLLPGFCLLPSSSASSPSSSSSPSLSSCALSHSMGPVCHQMATPTTAGPTTSTCPPGSPSSSSTCPFSSSISSSSETCPTANEKEATEVSGGLLPEKGDQGCVKRDPDGQGETDESSSLHLAPDTTGQGYTNGSSLLSSSSSSDACSVQSAPRPLSLEPSAPSPPSARSPSSSSARTGGQQENSPGDAEEDKLLLATSPLSPTSASASRGEGEREPEPSREKKNATHGKQSGRDERTHLRDRHKNLSSGSPSSSPSSSAPDSALASKAPSLSPPRVLSMSAGPDALLRAGGRHRKGGGGGRGAEKGGGRGGVNRREERTQTRLTGRNGRSQGADVFTVGTKDGENGDRGSGSLHKKARQTTASEVKREETGTQREENEKKRERGRERRVLIGRQRGWASQEKGRYAQLVYLHPKPIILILMPGSFSFISERRSKQEVVTEALHVLAKIHGGKVELPVKAFVSRWGKDPFARGSYSYLPPGTTGRDFDALAYPVHNRVLFAGEHTMRPFPSTAHGACLSGRREARRILDWSTGIVERHTLHKWFHHVDEGSWLSVDLNDVDAAPSYYEDFLQAPTAAEREEWFAGEIACAFCGESQTFRRPFIGCVSVPLHFNPSSSPTATSSDKKAETRSAPTTQSTPKAPAFASCSRPVDSSGEPSSLKKSRPLPASKRDAAAPPPPPLPSRATSTAMTRRLSSDYPNSSRNQRAPSSAEAEHNDLEKKGSRALLETEQGGEEQEEKELERTGGEAEGEEEEKDAPPRTCIRVAVHEDCCYHTPGVMSDSEGCRWFNVGRAVIAASTVRCALCHRTGASSPCAVASCSNAVHLPCAQKKLGWPTYGSGEDSTPLRPLFCPSHQSLLPPASLVKSASLPRAVGAGKKGKGAGGGGPLSSVVGSEEDLLPLSGADYDTNYVKSTMMVVPPPRPEPERLSSGSPDGPLRTTVGRAKGGPGENEGTGLTLDEEECLLSRDISYALRRLQELRDFEEKERLRKQREEEEQERKRRRILDAGRMTALRASRSLQSLNLSLHIGEALRTILMEDPPSRTSRSIYPLQRESASSVMTETYLHSSHASKKKAYERPASMTIITTGLPSSSSSLSSSPDDKPREVIDLTQEDEDDKEAEEQVLGLVRKPCRPSSRGRILRSLAVAAPQPSPSSAPSRPTQPRQVLLPTRKPTTDGGGTKASMSDQVKGGEGEGRGGGSLGSTSGNKDTRGEDGCTPSLHVGEKRRLLRLLLKKRRALGDPTDELLRHRFCPSFGLEGEQGERESMTQYLRRQFDAQLRQVLSELLGSDDAGTKNRRSLTSHGRNASEKKKKQSEDERKGRGSLEESSDRREGGSEKSQTKRLRLLNSNHTLPNDEPSRKEEPVLVERPPRNVGRR